MFEFRESSVSVVLECSAVTETYLSTIKENLINALHQKSQKIDGGGLFKFNVGHFSREASFWADQVKEL